MNMSTMFPLRTLQWQYHDGGRAQSGFKGKHVADCVVRSIAIVSGVDYQTIYDEIADGNAAQRRSPGRERRARSAQHGVQTSRSWFKRYMETRCFVWVPTCKIGDPSRLHLGSDLPDGRLVVSLSKHLTAVIDGVIYDTHNPTRMTDGRPSRMVYGYWRFLEVHR